MKHSKNQKENNNNLILSKNAINFLNNQKINIFESKITEMNFIFKINYIFLYNKKNRQLVWMLPI